MQAASCTFAIVVSALCLAQLGCGRATLSGSTSAAESTAQAGLFEVPADQLAHLKIAPVTRTSWSVAIHTTGTVDWDQDHTTQAITQVNGPITRILVDVGTPVKKDRSAALRLQSRRGQRHRALPQGPQPRGVQQAHRRPHEGNGGPRRGSPSRTTKAPRPTTTTPSPTCRTACSRCGSSASPPPRSTRPRSRARPSAPSWPCARPSPASSCRNWSRPDMLIQAGADRLLP